MKIIAILICTCCLGLVLRAQDCPKYTKAIKAGSDSLSNKNYKGAMRQFQIAQIASRECNLKSDELAQKFKALFDSLLALQKKALADQQKAEKATEEIRLALQRENDEKKRAELLKDFARSQTFANAAYAFCEKDPTMAVAFAINSLSIHANNMASRSLLKAFNLNSWFYSHKFDRIYRADLSKDGNILAISSKSSMRLIDLESDAEQFLSYADYDIRFLDNGNILLYKPIVSADRNITQLDLDKSDLILLSKTGLEIAKIKLKFSDISISGNRIIAWDIKNRSKLYVIEASGGSVNEESLPAEFNGHILRVKTFGKLSVAYGSDLNEVYITDHGLFKKILKLDSNFVINTVDFCGDQLLFSVYPAADSKLMGGYSQYDTKDLQGKASDTLKVAQVDKRYYYNRAMFLDESKMIFTTGNGIAQILDQSNGKLWQIAQGNAIDQITVLRKDSLIAIARRSGDVGIYNFEGQLVSNLIGSGGINEFNTTFVKMLTNDSNTRIFTLSRDGVLIWQKPVYKLMIKKLDGKSFEYLKGMNLKYSTNKDETPLLKLPVLVRRLPNTFSYSSYEEFSIRFSLGAFNDEMKTGLLKGVDGINGEGENKANLLSLNTITPYSAYYFRLFLLDPNVVYKIIASEMRQKRIRKLDEGTISQWVTTPEFKGKMNGKLSPVPITF